MAFIWERPVVAFYREQREATEHRTIAVVKARRIVITRVEEGSGFEGEIRDFFRLMGDIDYLSSEEGLSDRYVLCWFDDDEGDFSKAWRRLTGVTFPTGAPFTTNGAGKRTYNARFRAEHAKLES